METTIQSKKRNIKSVSYLLRKVSKNQEFISKETFESLNTSDLTYKLEWNKGKLEKEDYLKRTERILIDNIISMFNKLALYKQGNRIMPEADVFLAKTNSIRRPDAVYFTRNEIINALTHETVPQLLIEVISKSNSGNDIQKKIKEYFDNGPCSVWYIYPEEKLVYVYTSIKEVKINSDDEYCTAMLSDMEFKITVNEIFENFNV